MRATPTMTLLELRQQRDLSLSAVGILAGVYPSEVSRWERGLAKPRPQAIVRLAKGLGIAADTMAAILENSAKSSSGAA